MKSRIVLAVFLVLLVSTAVHASDVDFDLRLRGGLAAGADKLTIDPNSAEGSGDSSSNFQIDLNISPFQRSSVGPVFNVGFFKRTHSGSVQDVFAGLPQTSVDYDAAGLNLGAGVRIKPNENLHFEGKVEFSVGTGKPTLSTPGFFWNQINDEDYEAVSLVIGTYYTFTKPGLQAGLEVGYQSFTGHFQILDSFGFWNDGRVEGSGPIVNFVVGFRF